MRMDWFWWLTNEKKSENPHTKYTLTLHQFAIFVFTKRRVRSIITNTIQVMPHPTQHGSVMQRLVLSLFTSDQLVISPKL